MNRRLFERARAPLALAFAVSLSVALPLSTAGCLTLNDLNDIIPSGECSTGRAWTNGDESSPLMHPGGDCVGCHAARGGNAPKLAIAGTVMNAPKDDTDCGGIDKVIVEVTDADRNVHTMTTNAAGNFFLRAPEVPLALPFTVKLTLDGKERVMMTPQSNGSCVTCHTPEGKNGAPGRILAPK